MFTVREHAKTAIDLDKTFRRIRAIGYEAVQLSAVAAMNGDQPEVDAALARRMLDDNGLSCIATHRAWDRLANHTAEEIDFHHALGCDFAAIGGLREEEQTYERYRQFARDAASLIAKLRPAGIRFGYHNHSYEFFRPERQGKTLLDVLIDEATPELLLELDLYWIEHAGANSAKILERANGRVPVIHLKDKELAESGKDETRMAPIGEGNLDWPGIIAAGEAAGVRWYCVEQDHCYRDPFDCLKSSFEYLRASGL